MNALKFGLLVRTPLIAGESQEEFDQFRARLWDSFRPTNGAEEMLVERIVETGWRLRRFPVVEAAISEANILSEKARLARRKVHKAVFRQLEFDPTGTPDPEACRELQRQEREIQEAMSSPEITFGRACRRDFRGGAALTGLARCEMMLERSLHRAMMDLERLRGNHNEPTTARGTPAGVPHRNPFQRNPLDGNPKP